MGQIYFILLENRIGHVKRTVVMNADQTHQTRAEHTTHGMQTDGE